MSNAAFNVAFGAFLSAGLDYATCAAKSRELLDALEPSRSQTADDDDDRQREDEAQADFIVRACRSGEKGRSFFVSRIRSTSADPGHIVDMHLSQLTKAGLITAHGRRGYRVYRAVAS